MDDIKPLRWIAGSKDDLSAMPLEVRRHVGYALYAVMSDTRCMMPRKAASTMTPKS